MYLDYGKDRNKLEINHVTETSLQQIPLQNKTLSNKASDYMMFDLLKMMRENNHNTEMTSTQQIDTKPGDRIS